MISKIVWMLGLVLSFATAASAGEAEDMALGKKLFTSQAVPACAVCHTLADAGSEGAIGPVLDELKPSEDQVARALRDGLGQMPSYKNSLTAEQIKVLSKYVAKAAAGK
ncbi:cytochrome c [Limnobacter sp.]|uniref:SorU family sulfite dehydrogenase c-type cytochrome subunit n=1 Tax=Limnobacter sp. TaxID=2003368 RepID=UPI0027B8F878|nr:cytochrome c [Limnobacter sp.]